MRLSLDRGFEHDERNHRPPFCAQLGFRVGGPVGCGGKPNISSLLSFETKARKPVARQEFPRWAPRLPARLICALAGGGACPEVYKLCGGLPGGLQALWGASAAHWLPVSAKPKAAITLLCPCSETQVARQKELGPPRPGSIKVGSKLGRFWCHCFAHSLLLSARRC